MEEFDKKYYKIKDVADFIGVPQSTLRFWEKEFDGLKPVRTRAGARMYTPEDIRYLRIIHFLVKVQGLKIKAAREQIASNRKNVSKKIDTIDRLEEVRDGLASLLKALNVRK